MAIADWVSVAPRFSRSVNLERDAATETALDGYILTATGRDVLDRTCRAMAHGLGHRAWTITGSYGSGKSAFTLFLAQLLGQDGNPLTDSARSIVKQQAPELFGNYIDRRKKNSLVQSGYCPVLISGSPEPLVARLLRVAVAATEKQRSIRQSPGAKRLRVFLADCVAGKLPQPSEVVRALCEVSSTLRKSKEAQGLLIAIDELGKFLEFAARDPEAGDIFILQQLAEATEGDSGLVLITVLHQSFERYAAGLPASARQEWAKIQGRFEDVAFQESPEQFLALISHALYHTPSKESQAVRKAALLHTEEAIRLGLCPHGMKESEFREILLNCAPLHPLTAFVLVRLCRKFGQNERSLFAFLTSREPDSFLSFISELDSAMPQFYRLHRLYDYISNSLGTGLSVGENATKWAEIESALQRKSNGSINELNTIKCIGLLSAIGLHGSLRSSLEILAFALGTTMTETKKTLLELSKASVIVFRKHVESYALWQGSDVDLDAKLQDARKRIDARGLSAAELTARWHPRPIVARRHSYITGTLRYFTVKFADANSFWTSLEVPAESDGLILYCIPSNEDEHRELEKLATSAALIDRPSILMALPSNVDRLREAAYELNTLEWVERNTPELTGDPTARRELLSRKFAAQNNVEREVSRIFEPSVSLVGKTRWFHAGIEQPLPSSRRLSFLLSSICDRVYSSTPRLKNELLNRRSLSSSAAAARRNLIDAIVSKSTEQDLGFTGTPPEMSMYQSVLRATQIHSQRNAVFSFGEPEGDPGLQDVWRAITTFFEECELQRHAVSELFARLQRAPYGLKNGIIPVLFASAVVAHDTEIALYENDAFIPEITIEVWERLLRSSEKFKLRRYSITGVRKEVFALFGGLLTSGNNSNPAHLISVVRPLFRFITRLPAYSRQTLTVSSTAIKVRDALFSSKEPDALLFEELPRACGFKEFSATEQSGPDVAVFFSSLRSSLNELQHAYDDLLLRLQKILFASFRLESGEGLREIIRFRAHRLQDSAAEPRLKAFIHHLAEEHLDDVLWMEAIGTLLVGRPPKSWNDSDCAKYELNLTDVLRSFRSLEALVAERNRNLELGLVPAEIMRISVTDVHSRNREAVVVVQTSQSSKLAEAMISIEEALDHIGITGDANLALATLAAVSRKYLEDLDQGVSTEPRVAEKRGK